VGLLIFLFGFADGLSVHAAPVYQNTPGYNEPAEETPTDEPPPDDGYNAPATETLSVGETPIPESTVTETVTLAPDAFRTEDAEMGGAQTTPLVTETFVPTKTPDQVLTATKTQLPAVTPAAARKKGGFTPDWGMFWIGFAIPVLGACGIVLYLLDRRPDLFKRQ
jgi:hypothetical protein